MSPTIQLIISVVVLISTICFYLFIFRHDTKKLVLRRFHNAIKTAHKEYTAEVPMDDIIAQLYADFNGTISIIGKVRFHSLYDLIEQICCRYNTYSDRDFESVFEEPKNSEIRDFSCLLRREISKRSWYIELPSKESNWILDLKQELEERDSAFGMAALKQLALYIIHREKDRARRKVKIWEVVNILSILISFVVSIISLVQMFIAK